MKKLIDTFKALGNENRLQMLLWLQNPEKHFATVTESDSCIKDGHWVCVGTIADKAGLAQSVVSGYLNMLKQAGLVESQRVGKWTYYRYAPHGQEQLIAAIRRLFQHSI